MQKTRDTQLNWPSRVFSYYLAGIISQIIKEVQRQSKHCYICIYKIFKIIYYSYHCPYHQNYALFLPFKLLDSTWNQYKILKSIHLVHMCTICFADKTLKCDHVVVFQICGKLKIVFKCDSPTVWET